MTRDPTWFDLSWRHGVLELPDALTAPGPALELHMETDLGTGETLAWWTTDAGDILRVAPVGLA
jgi:hypothetical protein